MAAEHHTPIVRRPEGPTPGVPKPATQVLLGGGPHEGT
jgi:hypothetical protein